MANECFPLFESSDVTAQTTAAVTGKRFVDISADITSGPGLSNTSEGSNLKVAHAAAGAKAFGVSEYDAASGAKVGVIGTPGRIVPITSGAAITAGVQVEVGTAGKAITLASGIACGKAVTTASGADVDVYVKLN